MTKVIEMKKRLNFTPHPNTIFAKKVEKNKTKSGILLPEGKDNKTPIVEIVSLGSNVKAQYGKVHDFNLTEGDVVYVDPSFMRVAEIDETVGVIIPMDGIFGKIPQTEET